MHPFSQAPQVYPYQRATVADADGLKTTTSTSTSAVQLDNADYDGVEKVAAGRRQYPRSLTVSLAAQAGAYALTAWTFTGTYGGETVVATATPATANGNEVLVPVADGETVPQLFDDPAQVVIAIPAQAATNGSYTIGVRDIGAPKGEHLRGIRAVGAGNIELMGDDGKTEVIAMTDGEFLPITFTRVVGLAATTAGVMVGR